MKFLSAGYAASLRAEVRRISAAEAIPVVVQMQLTHRCNLRCPACPFSQKTREDSHLTLEEIDEVLTELSEAGTLYLVLSGGEIMTRDDFWKIAVRAKEKGFLLVLATNGSLIGLKELEAIKEISPFRVEINLLGTSPESHDRATCVQGSYHRTISAITSLRERGIKVSVRTCPPADRVGDPPRRDQRLKSAACVAPLCTSRCSSEEDGNAVALPRIAADAFRSSASSLLHRRSELFGRHGMPWEAKYRDDQTCVAGKALATISPSGEVRPCAMMPVELGNVRQHPFRKIWSSSGRAVLPERDLVNPLPVSCASRSASLSPCSTWPCSILRS